MKKRIEGKKTEHVCCQIDLHTEANPGERYSRGVMFCGFAFPSSPGSRGSKGPWLLLDPSNPQDLRRPQSECIVNARERHSNIIC